MVPFYKVTKQRQTFSDEHFPLDTRVLFFNLATTVARSGLGRAPPGVLCHVYIGAISQKCQFLSHKGERQQFANELSQQVEITGGG